MAASTTRPIPTPTPITPTRISADELSIIDRYFERYTYAPATSSEGPSSSVSVSLADYALWTMIPSISSILSYRHLFRWYNHLERLSGQNHLLMITAATSPSLSASLATVIANIKDKVDTIAITTNDTTSEHKRNGIINGMNSNGEEKRPARAKKEKVKGVVFKSYPSIDNCESTRMLRKIEAGLWIPSISTSILPI
jgi:hypothetical protein